MERNVGKKDRILRLILGLVLAFAPLLNVPAIWSSAVLAYASMAIGVILVLTAVLGTCPLYSVFGIRTCHNA